MKKTMLLSACIAVLVLLTACGSKSSDTPESTTIAGGDGANNESMSSGPTKAENTTVISMPTSTPPSSTAILDFTSYVGVWFIKDKDMNECSEDVYKNGGLVVQINDISEGYIRFKVECISAPPTNRIAEATVEAEFKNGKADFVFKDDGWGNAGSGRLELQDETVSMTITAYDSADANWGLPSQGQFVFIRDITKVINPVDRTKAIENPTRDNYREYLSGFGITDYEADFIIKLNNYIVNSKITSDTKIKELRDSYDVPRDVKFLDELIPLNSGDNETTADSPMTSQLSEQIDKRIIGCWFGYNINEERFAYKFDKSGKVTIAYIDAVFYGTTRYTTVDGLLFIESLKNVGAKEYAYSFDDKGLIIGSVDLDGENAKALESISEEKFNGLLQLIDEYKKK